MNKSIYINLAKHVVNQIHWSTFLYKLNQINYFIIRWKWNKSTVFSIAESVKTEWMKLSIQLQIGISGEIYSLQIPTRNNMSKLILVLHLKRIYSEFISIRKIDWDIEMIERR